MTFLIYLFLTVPNSKFLTNTLYLPCSNVLKHRLYLSILILLPCAALPRGGCLVGPPFSLPAYRRFFPPVGINSSLQKFSALLFLSIRKPFQIVKFNHLTSDQYECFCLLLSLFLFNSDLFKMEGKKAARKLRVKRKTKENRKGPE